MRLWQAEFGRGYRIPPSLDRMVDAGHLADMSWHNDISPSFGREDLPGGYEVRIWVDHPDPKKREIEDGGRYVVTVYDKMGQTPEGEMGNEFDSIHLALAEFHKLVKRFSAVCDCRGCPDCKGKTVCAKCGQCARCSSHAGGCEGCPVPPA